MTEKNIHQLLRKQFPHVDWQRIENSASHGAPDLNGCINGVEFWIETKIGKPLLRPSQVAWFDRAVRSGRRAFVLSHVSDKVQGETFEFFKPPFVYLKRGEKFEIERCQFQRSILKQIWPGALIDYLTS